MRNYYAIDIETYEEQPDSTLKPIKDTNKYILGATMDKNKKIQYHHSPKQQQQYILAKMQEHEHKNQKSYWYGHYSEYDFYGIFKDVMQDMITAGTLKVVSTRPMIAIFYEKQYLLDLSSFFYSKLADVGEMLGYRKLEMPEKVNNIEELKPYLYRDVEIVIEALNNMKTIMNSLGFKPQKYITGPSLSMNCFIAYLAKHPKAGWLLKSGKIHSYSENRVFLRQANRGGYNQAFQTGNFEDAYYIDINSAYWQAMKTMPFPDLLKEERLDQETIEFLGHDLILQKTGVVRCKVRVPKNIHVGILGCRYKPSNKSIYQQYFPTNGETITGTWTTIELKYAITRGYEIISMDEAIIYKSDLNFNPLAEYIDILWKYRSENADNKILNHFAKLLGNGLYGKFIQRRQNKEYKWIPRQDVNQWLEQGWKIESATEEYCISRQLEEYVPKYSSIILGTLITAYARLILIQQMEKLPAEDLLYCDTDGIIFKNRKNLNLFSIGNRLGEFKIEESGQCRINGEKKYWIGTTVKIAGLAKDLQTKDVLDHEKTVTSDKMIGFRQAIHFGGFQRTGTFEKVNTTYQTESKLNTILPETIVEEVL